jgi:hypothetical protein
VSESNPFSVAPEPPSVATNVSAPEPPTKAEPPPS